MPLDMMAKKEAETVADGSSAEKTSIKSSSKKRKPAALKEIEVDLNLPEPPSKKARRALKKGKTLPAKPQSSDDEAEDHGEARAAETSKTKKERSPYGVWIGNLRFHITKTELRKWLVDNSGGVITDEVITRVHMPTNKPASGGQQGKAAPENRGFAYVDFATFEANVAAIALSENELAGRKLLIKDSKNFDGRPKKEMAEETPNGDDIGTAQTTDEPTKKKSFSTKVFVGNLPFQVSEDDLRNHFEKCGKIRWIKVATFEDSGKCKGYGWVNFEEPEAASWAVKGFVKVRETIDTLEDFMDETPGGTEKNNRAKDDEAEDKDGETTPKKKKSKETDTSSRIKTRKWWVNQLFGRPLKIELAEDDQTRYNKRFRGKGQQKQRQQVDGQAPTGGDTEGEPTLRPTVTKEKRDIAYADDLNIARLTGAPVAPQGRKTTFV